MKKILVGAAVGTAGLVALTGATYAQTDGVDTSETVKDRVAQILGIDSEELHDAFNQARDEHRDAKIEARLAYSVENGVITQVEADSVLAWINATPESLDGVAGYGKVRIGGIGYFVNASLSEERTTAIVERLIAAEKITTDEAVAVVEWLSRAPSEALAKLGGGFDDDEHTRSGGHERGRGEEMGRDGRGHGQGLRGRLFEGRFEFLPYSPPASDAETSETGVSAPTALAGKLA